ncbi:MAG: hypothetical protein OXD50_04245 [Chloroflexi bacterium]|nr:hypothetical protein [Chloroflexota bacterium]
MQTVIGAALLNFGLLTMLVSYLVVFGLGLKSGLIAAFATPLLIIGIWQGRSWARLMVVAAGTILGCGWLYMALAWDS